MELQYLRHHYWSNQKFHNTKHVTIPTTNPWNLVSHFLTVFTKCDLTTFCSTNRQIVERQNSKQTAAIHMTQNLKPDSDAKILSFVRPHTALEGNMKRKPHRRGTTPAPLYTTRVTRITTEKSWIEIPEIINSIISRLCVENSMKIAQNKKEEKHRLTVAKKKTLLNYIRMIVRWWCRWWRNTRVAAHPLLLFANVSSSSPRSLEV